MIRLAEILKNHTEEIKKEVLADNILHWHTWADTQKSGISMAKMVCLVLRKRLTDVTWRDNR